MNREREQVVNVLFTAVLVGTGMLLTTPVITGAVSSIGGVVSGISVGVAASLTWQG